MSPADEIPPDQNNGIIYDDAYGIWTEDDQVSLAAEACRILDEPVDSRE